MANLRDIRRRIKSVKNTAQITKAMQLVAAAKMRRAQEQALGGRPYVELLNKVLVHLREHQGDSVHPLLEERPVRSEIVIVLSTDKGLCGALNTNTLRLVQESTTEASILAQFVTMGSKGRQTLSRLKRDLIADFPSNDPATFADAKTLGKFAVEKFLSGECDRVRVAFPNFVSTLKQEPRIETLLPISNVNLGNLEADLTDANAAAEGLSGFGYLFEPSASEVYDHILPHYVHYQLYQMLLEARASEHSARMVAMKSASDNANQLIKDLTLEYNKLRQAAITNELLEITTAMKALE